MFLLFKNFPLLIIHNSVFLSSLKNFQPPNLSRTGIFIGGVLGFRVFIGGGGGEGHNGNSKSLLKFKILQRAKNSYYQDKKDSQSIKIRIRTAMWFTWIVSTVLECNVPWPSVAQGRNYRIFFSRRHWRKECRCSRIFALSGSMDVATAWNHVMLHALWWSFSVVQLVLSSFLNDRETGRGKKRICIGKSGLGISKLGLQNWDGIGDWAWEIRKELGWKINCTSWLILGRELKEWGETEKNWSGWTIQRVRFCG